MRPPIILSGPANTLRQQAEATLRETTVQSTVQLEALSLVATQELIHDLRVHQVELEMQNEELRQSQAELEISQARYFHLYDLAPVGYCTVSIAGVVLQANLTLATMLGVTRGVLMHQPLGRFIARADQDNFHLLCQRLIKIGIPQRHELRLVLADDREMWAQLEATFSPALPVLWSLGAAEGPTASPPGAGAKAGPATESFHSNPPNEPTLRIVLSDISDRKHAEAALQERDVQHWAILQTALAGFWLVDATGRLLEVNEAYCRMSGYSTAELLTMYIIDLEAADTAEATAAHIQTVLAGGGKVFECRHRRKDGSTFEVEVSFQFHLVAGGQLVVFLQDITERKRAQQELDAERAHHSSFYNLAPVGYATVSEAGLILEANLPLASLLGVSRTALLQQPFARFILPEEAVLFHRLHQQLLAAGPGGKAQTCKVRMVKRDATLFWAQLEATIAPASPGIPTLCRVVLSDITVRKQVEAEQDRLAVQNQQLQKAESLGRMAAAIAHHFNNQLQAVMGNLELALSDPAQHSRPTENLTAAMKAARKAAEMSGSMLTYLGKTPGQQEPLDLAAACQRGLPLLRVALPTHQILTTDLPSPGPTISGNEHQLLQVLTHLFTNAWEAGGDRPGTIHLSVRTVAASAIPSARLFPRDWQPQDPAYACLEIADTGCGITEEAIEKIFDPFFSSKFTGRGLGLAVVLGIVRAHHGAITVRSSPGLSSVFQVYFPVSTAVLPRTPVLPEPSAKLAEGATVLVIEDERSVRLSTVLALRQFGFTVLTAENGREAVQLFQAHVGAIDCVLCDVNMPHMDGWETLSALRQLSPDLPVILCSGYHESLVMAGHHSDQPQAFLGKPYSFEALRRTIAEVLAHRKAEPTRGL